MRTLWNHTKVPDELLAPVITAAARAVGARSARVPVKLVAARGRGSSGQAERVWWVCRWVLAGRCKVRNPEGRIVCDGGYISVTFPCNPLSREVEFHGFGPIVKRFFEVLLHEFAHIKDFQAGRSFRHVTVGSSGRQVKWGKRPIELSAVNRYAGVLHAGWPIEKAARLVLGKGKIFMNTRTKIIRQPKYFQSAYVAREPDMWHFLTEAEFEWTMRRLLGGSIILGK